MVVWGVVLGYLGWSCGSFWASWAVSATSWSRLGNALRIYKPMETLRAPLGSILRPPWHPKRKPRRSPRRLKIDFKTDVKSERFPTRSADRLKPFLVRSWCRLGVGFGRFLLENVMFRENRRFRSDVVSRPVLDRFWAGWGRQRRSKTRPGQR